MKVGDVVNMFKVCSQKGLPYCGLPYVGLNSTNEDDIVWTSNLEQLLGCAIVLKQRFSNGNHYRVLYVHKDYEDTNLEETCGYWITLYKCSKCGKEFFNKYDVCPACEAPMKMEDENEEKVFDKSDELVINPCAGWTAPNEVVHKADKEDVKANWAGWINELYEAIFKDTKHGHNEDEDEDEN